MPAPPGKVNESLSAAMSYKGNDGLSDAERRAYDACRPLSCKHEACYKQVCASLHAQVTFIYTRQTHLPRTRIRKPDAVHRARTLARSPPPQPLAL